jgi:hypothetical protein
MEPDEISTRKAAHILRCSIATVRNYYHAGMLEGRIERVGVMGATRLWLKLASVEQLAQQAPAEGKSL